MAAKLAAGLRKPNRQSVVLPSAVVPMIHPLKVGSLPGIGHSTAALLQSAGIEKVSDVVSRLVGMRAGATGSTMGGCSLFDPNDRSSLAAACKALRLGEGTFAQRQAILLSRLCCGRDDSQVVPMEPPKQLSDEDSFRRIDSSAALLAKIRELCTGVLSRLMQDGRTPMHLRLQVLRNGRNRVSRSVRVPAKALACLQAPAPSSSGSIDAVSAEKHAPVPPVAGPFGSIPPVAPVPGRAPPWATGSKAVPPRESVDSLAKGCWVLLCQLVPEVARRNLSFERAHQMLSAGASAKREAPIEPPIIVLNVGLTEFKREPGHREDGSPDDEGASPGKKRRKMNSMEEWISQRHRKDAEGRLLTSEGAGRQA